MNKYWRPPDKIGYIYNQPGRVCQLVDDATRKRVAQTANQLQSQRQSNVAMDGTHMRCFCEQASHSPEKETEAMLVEIHEL